MSIAFASESFRDLMVVLGAAGLVIPAFAVLRISPVVGFILIGIVAGPHGLGMLRGQFPWLAYITITDAETLDPAAEIGIAMLLFGLGLELTVERLRTMRCLVFGLGPVQLVSCALAIGIALLPAGLPLATVTVLALGLALSSTAVGMQMLSTSGHLNSRTGRTAFGILLFQDIAIAPILLVLNLAVAPGGVRLALLRALIAGA